MINTFIIVRVLGVHRRLTSFVLVCRSLSVLVPVVPPCPIAPPCLIHHCCSLRSSCCCSSIAIPYNWPLFLLLCSTCLSEVWAVYGPGLVKRGQLQVSGANGQNVPNVLYSFIILVIGQSTMNS